MFSESASRPGPPPPPHPPYARRGTPHRLPPGCSPCLVTEYGVSSASTSASSAALGLALLSTLLPIHAGPQENLHQSQPGEVAWQRTDRFSSPRPGAQRGISGTRSACLHRGSVAAVLTTPNARVLSSPGVIYHLSSHHMYRLSSLWRSSV